MRIVSVEVANQLSASPGHGNDKAVKQQVLSKCWMEILLFVRINHF